jgi:uncharacterized membrane protein YsdA (DUF1294 family)
MRIGSQIRRFLIAALAVVVLVSALCWRMGLGVLWSYVLGINLAAAVLYGFDKLQARRSGARVPEAVLHLLALAGGTPGALLGQVLFRHKTRKRSFRRVFLLVVVLQAGTIAAYMLLRGG